MPIGKFVANGVSHEPSNPSPRLNLGTCAAWASGNNHRISRGGAGSHNDWVPTLCSFAGEPNIVRQGYAAGGKTYKVHQGGYDQSAFLRVVTGTAANNNGAKSARDKFFYTDDEVVKFAATFKQFPPRSIPPSFSAYTIMEETINEIKAEKRRAAEAGK